MHCRLLTQYAIIMIRWFTKNKIAYRTGGGEKDKTGNFFIGKMIYLNIHS